MNISKKLQSVLGKDLQENVVLRDYTTMKVGGVADYFYIAKNINDLIKAALAAKEANLPYVVLGGASNVLISDYGFAGLVILNRTSNIAFLMDKSQVIVDSGVSLSRLIMELADKNLSGVEPLFGIPGTVGGAVYGNIGANGIEISQFIKNITVLSENGKIARYKADWLKPKYRSTHLRELKKMGKEIPIILSVKLQLAANKKEDILRKISHFKKLKEERQPYDKPTCGSVFKNLPFHPKNFTGESLPKEKAAGYLLDKIGVKGMKVGGAQVSKKHANFIINTGQAKAADIRSLIEKLKDEANVKHGVSLEEEIEYVGNWK